MFMNSFFILKHFLEDGSTFRVICFGYVYFFIHDLTKVRNFSIKCANELYDIDYQIGTKLQNPMLLRKIQQPRRIPQLQLAQDILPVRVHRKFTDR